MRISQTLVKISGLKNNIVIKVSNSIGNNSVSKAYKIYICGCIDTTVEVIKDILSV